MRNNDCIFICEWISIQCMGRLFIHGFTDYGYRLLDFVLRWSIINGTIILWSLFRTAVFPNSRILPVETLGMLQMSN